VNESDAVLLEGGFSGRDERALRCFAAAVPAFKTEAFEAFFQKG